MKWFGVDFLAAFLDTEQLHWNKHIDKEVMPVSGQRVAGFENNMMYKLWHCPELI